MKPRAIYHIDFETFSECDLRKLGAYKYASHKSTEILMLSVARGDGPRYRWYNPKYEDARLGIVTDPEAWAILDEMAQDPDCLVYAHNAQFEMALTRYRWDKDIGTVAPTPRQWRCTATMARVAALPPSLEQCAKALSLSAQKDKEGSRLIMKFSVPQKVHKSKQLIMGTSYRINPKDEPKEFIRFADYCVQDVAVEQQIHQRLKSFELTGAMEEAFMFDSEMNDRGIPVNLKALRNARRIVRECMADLNKEFFSIVGCNQTQGEVFKRWLAVRDYPGTDLKALTVENALETAILWAEPKTIRALELHACLAFAAVKKLDAMVNCECGDGYVRGTMRFYGAGTGRWSASLIQPQNFKRPSPHLAKVTDKAYAMICDGCTREELEMMYGDPIEVIASCIRHFLQRPSGNFLDADYAAIEARIVCWLAGQEDALVRFRRYDAATDPAARKLLDPYVHMGGVIYNKRAELVNKDERWVGKQSVLGCGYSMWVDAFQAQCSKYGVDLPWATCEKAVLEYRKVYGKVAELWDEFEQAARLAINNHGKWFEAGPKVSFGVTKMAGILYLVMRLPSGRNIVYPHVKIEWVKRHNKFTGKSRMTEQITFWGVIKDNFWGRKATYGAMLVENATQGTAFDVMAHGSINAANLGFEIPMLVHDQALGNEEPGKTIVDFSAALCNTPPWADGLPVVAEGGVVPYYTKD